LAFLAGTERLTKETAIAASRDIISKNQCEVVVVSMGAKGALLITDSLVEQILPPEVKVKSTVGAGDSMVAGITLSLSGNKTFIEALQFGVACGTATTMNEGTALCDSDDVEYLYNLLNKNS
jgi:6-phosphofructokinase 2